jgi:hypothetical protein
MRYSFVLILIALAASSGCGKNSGRLPVLGTITLNGVPLDGGSIQFTSVGAERMVASGAMVNAGSFHIPQENGLMPGKYHVEISAPDVNAAPIMIRQTPGGPGIPIQPDRVPPEYNVESKQTVDVTADGDNRFEFNIVTTAKK